MSALSAVGFGRQVMIMGTEHSGAEPLAGIKVVELGMWVFVPAAGAVLADMGADVIKIEPPSGDPIRVLTNSGVKRGPGELNPIFEAYNRGKRSIAIDLKADGGLDLLHSILEDADVFLTSLLAPARRSLGIDVDDLRTRHPNLIYAMGTGQGTRGPDADKGGFDAISFWARGGVASAVAPPEALYPSNMPCGAFGDGVSGTMLAGGIAAAIARRALTGEPSVVEVSLLGASMWAMQVGIVNAVAMGVDELPKGGRMLVPNPLVNTYRTSDGRFISICMPQAQRYWPRLCEVLGRPDLATDPRFETDEARSANLADCVAILDDVFATKTLKDCESVLADQDGPWTVVQKAGELPRDPQSVANSLTQDVDYGQGRRQMMVSSPMQFDGEVLPAAPAPELGADKYEVLAELGLSEDEIVDLQFKGIVE